MFKWIFIHINRLDLFCNFALCQQIPVLFTPEASQLQQSLLPGAETTISDTTLILLPRDTCTSFTHLCAVVTPGVNSTYSLPSASTTHITCVNIAAVINCDGK